MRKFNVKIQGFIRNEMVHRVKDNDKIDLSTWGMPAMDASIEELTKALQEKYKTAILAGVGEALEFALEENSMLTLNFLRYEYKREVWNDDAKPLEIAVELPFGPYQEDYTPAWTLDFADAVRQELDGAEGEIVGRLLKIRDALAGLAGEIDIALSKAKG